MELIEAQDWYEDEAARLGRRFRESINRLVERMSGNPHQFPVVYRNVRRALLRRFPYSLFFVMDSEGLIVIACFHSSRDPSDWQRGLRRELDMRQGSQVPSCSDRT
jgi:plasmid stabilization system protein ParE